MRAKHRFCFQHGMDELVAQETQAEVEMFKLEQAAAEKAAAGAEKMRLNEEAAGAEKAEVEAVAVPASDQPKATGDLSERQTTWKEICDGASGNGEAQRPRVILRGKASYPLFRGGMG